MVMIKVARPFMLRREGLADKVFKPGLNNVSDDVAAHWYVRANLEDEPEIVTGDAAVLEDPDTPIDGGAGSADAGQANDLRKALLTDARQLGVAVDGRWSDARIKAAIAMSGQAGT